MADVRLVNWRAEQVAQETMRAAHPHVCKIADQICEEIKLLLATKWPPPSTSGQPPHYRTGDLQRSYDWRAIGQCHARIETSSPYAVFLEKGTLNMAPRPHARPALEKFKPHFSKIAYT